MTRVRMRGGYEGEGAKVRVVGVLNVVDEEPHALDILYRGGLVVRYTEFDAQRLQRRQTESNEAGDEVGFRWNLQKEVE